MQRLNQQLTGMQTQLLQHRQVSSATQVALDRGIKQLVDMDKRLLSVGAPPSSGMMRAFVGGLTQAAEMHEQQQAQHIAHQMLVREAHAQGLAQAQGLMQQGRTRSRKGKKEGKTLRAEAPEFIPSSAPNGGGDGGGDGGDDAD